MSGRELTLKEKQSLLFDQWGPPAVTDAAGHKIRPGFNSDGVIDEYTWNTQKVKVLFILKETNDGFGSLAYTLNHLREDIESGRRPERLNGKVKTWSNISCWLCALQDIASHQGSKVDYVASLHWRDYEPQGTASRVAQNIKRTVILNLKKTPGGASSNDRIIEKAFLSNLELFKSQYNLYNPDIVVCCGSVVEKCIREYGVIQNYDSTYSHHLDTAVGKIWYYAPQSGPVIIGFFHPQPRAIKHSQLFHALAYVAAAALDRSK